MDGHCGPERNVTSVRRARRTGKRLTLFPFADYWWFYAGFTLFVVLMLAVDLGVFHRSAHAVSAREAARWSAVWITLALVFNLLLYQFTAGTFGPDVGSKIALEFLAGYVVEYTLSIDNMFVFVVIFSFFAVPSHLQHRVLFYGILGALVFRAIFIALGSVLLSYHLVVILFGVALIATGVRMLFHESGEASPDRNPLVRLTRRMLPVSGGFHGKHFFVRIDRVWHATPLLLALMAIEMSDIVFAIDSVPAIFALTSEPLIVFTSNVFAILGLQIALFRARGGGRQVHAATLRTCRSVDFHRAQDVVAEPVSDHVVAGDHRGADRQLDRGFAPGRDVEST